MESSVPDREHRAVSALSVRLILEGELLELRLILLAEVTKSVVLLKTGTLVVVGWFDFVDTLVAVHLPPPVVIVRK